MTDNNRLIPISHLGSLYMTVGDIVKWFTNQGTLERFSREELSAIAKAADVELQDRAVRNQHKLGG
jgi:hypothetical protein